MKFEDQSDKSSDYMMSDIDDKDDPNYFKKDKTFFNLPLNVRRAIESSQHRSKHSDFYYRLTDLKHKISIYNGFFRAHKTSYQLQYEQKNIQRSQVKQKKDREYFDEDIKRVKKKLAARLQTSSFTGDFLNKDIPKKLDNLLDYGKMGAQKKKKGPQRFMSTASVNPTGFTMN